MNNTTHQNLKQYNVKFIWSFLLFNILLLGILFFERVIQNIYTDYKSILTLRSALIVIMPIFIFIINGLISSQLKSILVFWKIKDSLPGCRSFSKYAPKDFRIDMKKVKLKYGKLPKSPKKQNSLWYQIYQKHTNNQLIINSHRSFLLARDLTSISFIIIIVSLIFIFLHRGYNYGILYFFYAIIQYIILAITAQNYGKRFITNVIAIDSLESTRNNIV